MLTNENVQILDLVYCDVCHIIKKSSYPRIAKISKCERFVVIFFTDNTVGIYLTEDGSQISKIIGIPRSVNTFVISANSQKLLYANNQTLCIWNISKGGLDVMSNQWRNINCYSIRGDATQVAIGTYTGKIILLTFLTNERVSELEIVRHKNCVMMIGYCKDDSIISLSFDMLFVRSTISRLPNGQKGISFDEIIMKSIPRSIQEAGGVVFFGDSDGSIGWITTGNKLLQYSNALYSVTEHDGAIIFIKYKEGEIEWFQSE